MIYSRQIGIPVTIAWYPKGKRSSIPIEITETERGWDVDFLLRPVESDEHYLLVVTDGYRYEQLRRRKTAVYYRKKIKINVGLMDL